MYLEARYEEGCDPINACDGAKLGFKLTRKRIMGRGVPNVETARSSLTLRYWKLGKVDFKPISVKRYTA